MKFICESSSGQKGLAEFYPAFSRGTIQIESIPNVIRDRLMKVAFPGTPLGALFVTDGYQGTIYADLQSELGILIPFLFHEIIHSLDPTLWRAARQVVSHSEKQNLIFEAECRAFEAQHCLQEELKEIYPELRTFHETSYPNVPFLNRRFLPHEIAELYKGIYLIPSVI